MNQIKRGDIYMVDFGEVVGSEQKGVRPALVIQNDVGNVYSPTVIVAAITDGNKRDLPTHVPIERSNGLPKDSVVMFEQIRTVDKRRLIKKKSHLFPKEMDRMEQALKISLGLISVPHRKEVQV